ncbi:MAG: AI-2E family transporter [Patescibacteria group bacterium]
MEKQKFEISWTSLWRVFFMLILVVGLYAIAPILTVLFLAIVISSALDAPLNYLESKKIPRLLGILFIFVAIISILFLLLYTIIPIVLIEFKELVGNLDKVEEALGGIFGISKITEKWEAALSSVAGEVFSGNFSFLNFLPRIFENALLLIATVVISFYLALYRDGVENFLRAIMPLSYENYAIDVFHRARKKIGKWLEGQIFLSLIIAIVTTLGLTILGVKYSLVLGLIAGMLEIIPFVGPVIAGILAFLVAMPQSFVLGIYTIILFVAIQQFEAHLLVPVVMRKTTGVHPVMAVLAILVGAQILGFVGVILAIPFMVVIQELVEDFSARKYRQQTL